MSDRITPKQQLPPVTTVHEPRRPFGVALWSVFVSIPLALFFVSELQIENWGGVLIIVFAPCFFGVVLFAIGKVVGNSEISWDENQLWYRSPLPWVPNWQMPWESLDGVLGGSADLDMITKSSPARPRSLVLPKGSDRTKLIIAIGKHLTDTEHTETVRPFQVEEAQQRQFFMWTGRVLLVLILVAMTTMVAFKFLPYGDWIPIVCVFGVSMAAWPTLQAIRAYRAYKNAPLGDPDQELDDLFYDRYGDDAPHIARFYRHVWSQGSDFTLENLPDWKPVKQKRLPNKSKNKGEMP